MVRSDEFFNFLMSLQESFPEKQEDNYSASNYGITQAVLNSFNYKHNLPMERVETLRIEKAKDIYLEYFYLPVKSVINPEIHFNFIDVYYINGCKIYTDICGELGENFTINKLYEWRRNYYNTIFPLTIKIEPWLERLSKIRAYFKYR